MGARETIAVSTQYIGLNAKEVTKDAGQENNDKAHAENYSARKTRAALEEKVIGKTIS